LNSEPVASRPAVASRARTRMIVAAGLLACAAVSGAAYQQFRTTSSAGRIVGDAPEAEATRAVLRLPARYRADTSLYGSYLRGLALRFGNRFRESRDTLTALVDRAPLYVPGVYGLGHAHALLAMDGLSDRDLMWPRVDVLARRALALDSSAASAWLLLASRDMHSLGDLSRAGERLLRARALDAHDPDVPAMRAVWFRYLGQMDSAVVESQRAYELEPLSAYFARAFGKQLYFARDYAEAMALYTRWLRDDPAWSRVYPDVAYLYLAMGRPRDAAAWFARVRAAEGDSAAASALAAPSSDSAARRLIMTDARRTLARLEASVRNGQRPAPQRFAVAYATLQDTARTLQWLDTLVTQHAYVSQVRVDPLFDFIRADPRYVAWASRNRF
ncbi:MAG TPA: tetratricopeptide repeat protein, partial [Gemmatimonadaceae bacterium]|nr:tetratricopeptide repeat protein [Gemmatimonadaceae bacterium]